MCWKKAFPFMNRLDTNNGIFQRDNTAIHTSKLKKDWFKTKNIEVLNRTTKSSNLNPVENLWGILSRTVYKSKRQFKDRETWKSCIEQYWNEIHLKFSENFLIQFKKFYWNSILYKYWTLYNFAVKYKFSKLSYTYYHLRKCIFLKNIFCWKVVIKSNMYTNAHWI